MHSVSYTHLDVYKRQPVACSRVFASIKNHTGKKAVVLMLDDLGDAEETSENTAWIYDTDFVFLNDDSITQVICLSLIHISPCQGGGSGFEPRHPLQKTLKKHSSFDECFFDYIPTFDRYSN